MQEEYTGTLLEDGHISIPKEIIDKLKIDLLVVCRVLDVVGWVLGVVSWINRPDEIRATTISLGRLVRLGRQINTDFWDFFIVFRIFRLATP